MSEYRSYHRRNRYADDGPPPEPYVATPEEIERSRRVHAQLQLDQVEYFRKLKAGEIQPHQVLTPCREND